MDNLCELSDEESAECVDQMKNVLIGDHNRVSKGSGVASGAVTASSCLSTSPLQSPHLSKTLLPQQAIRSQLRRDFLRLLSSLHKRKVCLKLYECPLVLTATFEGCDHDLRQLFVTSFKTPIGVQKCSVIRTNDVIELEFPLDPNHDIS